MFRRSIGGYKLYLHKICYAYIHKTHDTLLSSTPLVLMVVILALV